MYMTVPHLNISQHIPSFKLFLELQYEYKKSQMTQDKKKIEISGKV